MNITHDMSNDLTEYDPESRQVDGPNPIENRISSSAARVPDIISCTSGITVQGRQLHSFAFTTDAAIIRNTNADAILAVYPFTGEPVITQALLTAAQAPLFVGVGGGTTTGPRVIQLAMMAEMQGAAGVVLNAPAPPSTVYDVARITNTPVIATVLTCDDELDEKIEAGASIINVAAGRRTPDVVQQIRQRHPSIPLLASGGSTDESMAETIVAGANALTWTPPIAQEMERSMMMRYRGESPGDNMQH